MSGFQTPISIKEAHSSVIKEEDEFQKMFVQLFKEVINPMPSLYSSTLP